MPASPTHWQQSPRPRQCPLLPQAATHVQVTDSGKDKLTPAWPCPQAHWPCLYLIPIPEVSQHPLASSPTPLPAPLTPYPSQDDWRFQAERLSLHLSEEESKRAQAQSRAGQLQKLLAEADEGDLQGWRGLCLPQRENRCPAILGPSEAVPNPPPMEELQSPG